MYRLFIALDFPSYAKQALLGLCSGLKGAKWVTEQQLHLTLRFIGEVDGGVMRDVGEALDQVAVAPFELEIKGVGFFPPRRTPEILWAGVEKNEALVHLHNKIESILVRAGIAPDNRKFIGHITLARLKVAAPELVARYLAANSLFRIAPFAVNQFHLYSSFLASEGAIHTLEASYVLTANRSGEE